MPRKKGQTIRPLEVQQIVTMRDSGKTWNEIEAVMGYCKGAIRIAYQRAGGKNWRTYKGIGPKKMVHLCLSVDDHAIYTDQGGVAFLRKCLQAVKSGDLSI